MKNNPFDIPHCEKCNDTGYIDFKDENGCWWQKECECLKRRRVHDHLKQSGAARLFIEKSFDNYETSGNAQRARAKAIAEDFVDHFEQLRDTPHNSMLLCGQVGAGKTHLGTAACKSLMEKHEVTALYMPYRDIITKIKQNVLESDTYKAEIKKYSTVEVLYIDDMLKGKCTESDLNILYEIINYRYNNMLSIIISTEKRVHELIEWDEATGSRIIEMCTGHIMEFRGSDLNHRIYR